MSSEKRELRTEAVSITVTPTQRAMVDMMAERDDRSMASMLRIIIAEAFEKRGLTLDQ
ncbi:hypothetical protein LCGC14_0842200, partial [marine sediment metagenome]